MLTQQWVLSPEIEINFHGKNDEAREVGSGLSNIEAGIRLRYEVKREFAPYIGIHWEKKFGNTADYAREEYFTKACKRMTKTHIQSTHSF